VGSVGVSKVPSPVAGFNSNVRHRGAVFHVQTEDSGSAKPRIVTHLFADGGRILRTLRSEYAEHVGREDLSEFVRSLMLAQHKTMYVSLRGGELDELIEEACGPLSLPASGIAASRLSLPPELASLRPSFAGRSPSGQHAIERPPQDEPSAVHALPVPVIPKRSSAPPRRISGEVLAVRPSGGSGALPVPPSSRGDAAISEQSLDDVILSCLADELDASQK
jgi:hypothetical protein